MPEKNLPADLRDLIATPEPPDLGPGPRSHIASEAQLRKQAAALADEHKWSESPRQLVLGLALLWHDHLDAAHTIAQAMENADGSYVHAIMHRREPDYGNAQYWFRRVGEHACFAPLADRTAALLKSKDNAHLATKLVVKGRWNADAFIKACEAASSRPASDPETHLLRAVQALEFEILLEHLAGSER